MSYDIDLRDPVSGKVLDLPCEHTMTGGTYRAYVDQVTGEFRKLPISEAHLNITYNYSSYYYKVTDGDPRFANIGSDDSVQYGIRGIYGKTGAESIQMLEDMIERIRREYTTEDGKWIQTQRTRAGYRCKLTGAMVDAVEGFMHNLSSNPDWERQEWRESVSEGPCDDYWEATAGNALRPLYQLLAMARLRPDGVWDGD